MAAVVTFEEASEKVNPILMEPVMQPEAVAPEENMDNVIGDLDKRRG